MASELAQLKARLKSYEEISDRKQTQEEVKNHPQSYNEMEKRLESYKALIAQQSDEIKQKTIENKQLKVIIEKKDELFNRIMEISNQNVEVSKTLIKDGRATKKKKNKPKGK